MQRARGLGMQFFANGLTGTYLRNVLPRSDVQVEWVKAAIAYGDDEHSLLTNAVRAPYSLRNKRTEGGD